LRKTSHSVINHIPITKARINLGQLARRAHNSGEYFILEKDGIPVIGIMAADEMEDYLELKDPEAQASIARTRKEFASGKGRPAGKLIVELATIAKRAKISKPSK